MADSFVVPPELANTYWGQLVTAEPGFGPRSRVGSATPTAGNTAKVFNGGKRAPSAAEMTPQIREALRQSGGTNVSEAQGRKLLETGWKYGDPAPKGFAYDSFGRIADEYTLAQGMGQVALAAIPLAATAVTAGAASPYLAATVGGASAFGAAKGSGASWKQALIAGGLGAAAGGIGASALSTPAKVAGQAGVGAAGGAQNGGGLRGALVGAAMSGGATAANAATAPKGGGTVPAATTPAVKTPSLSDYLIQAGLGAAAGAGGGMTGIAIGAGLGATGAATGRTNTQAAASSASNIAANILSGAQAAGQASGNAAAAREAGRKTETDNIVTQDQQRLQATTAKENAVQGRAGIEIDQRTEGRAAGNDAYKNALLSALAMNMQDVSINRPKGVPHMSFSGGARPSAIGEQGREAAGLMNARSLDTLRNPQALSELPAMESFTPSVLPKATGVDTALGIGGVVGDVLAGMSANKQAAEKSALIDALLKQSQQQATQGLDPSLVPPQPPKPRTVQDDIDAVNARMAGAYA
jgi:hypothetical protein